MYSRRLLPIFSKHVNMSQQVYRFIKFLEKIEGREPPGFAVLKHGNVEEVNEITDEMQIEMIEYAVETYNYEIVYHMLNKGIEPSQKVQLHAIDLHSDFFEFFIKNGIIPSEKVQLEAAYHSPILTILYNYGINPSERVKLVSIENNPEEYTLIKNPSEEFTIECIKRNGYVMKYIENPTEDMQIAAVMKHGPDIDYIVEKGIIPSENVQLAAVKKATGALNVLYKNNIKPSENVRVAAIKYDERQIVQIPRSDRTPAVKKALHDKLMYFYHSIPVEFERFFKD